MTSRENLPWRSFGGRQLWLNSSTNISYNGVSASRNRNQNLGFKPAWTAGFNYTPTAKTSVAFSTGEQGSDIVPELNFLLSWSPREKTTVSVGVSQAESYSNIAASQYLITRGIVGTVNQQLFSNISVVLSGGYTKQFYQNINGGRRRPRVQRLRFRGAIIWRQPRWFGRSAIG